MSAHPIGLSKKICLLGATAVGKTSLVQRYLQSTFDEAYKSTIGVNIHAMDVASHERPVRLMIWDLEGQDEPMQRYREDYMRGAHGYLLVVDSTRAETLDIARSLHEIAASTIGDVPFVALLNKWDLLYRRDLHTDEVAALLDAGWVLFETSAKSGENVREAFERLTQQILAADQADPLSPASLGNRPDRNPAGPVDAS